MKNEFRWTPEAKSKLLACRTHDEMQRAFPNKTLLNLVRRRTEFRTEFASRGEFVDYSEDRKDSTPKQGNIKILLIDIETSPNLADVWSLWNVNVGLSQLRESSFMMCWAAKWMGSDEVEFRSYFHDGKELMLQRVYELLDEADAVVHYNGIKFDIRTLNKEFLLAGYPPPAAAKQIDLYRTVKNKFLFPSNKLAYVSEILELGGKVSHAGHEMWLKCLAGDKEAWKVMKEYNIQDTKLLEDLYFKMLPWITNHPNQNLYSDFDEEKCTNCNSGNIEEQKYTYTAASKYVRYVCKDCGTSIRAAKRERGVNLHSEKF